MQTQLAMSIRGEEENASHDCLLMGSLTYFRRVGDQGRSKVRVAAFVSVHRVGTWQ